MKNRFYNIKFIMVDQSERWLLSRGKRFDMIYMDAIAVLKLEGKYGYGIGFDGEIQTEIFGDVEFLKARYTHINIIQKVEIILVPTLN